MSKAGSSPLGASLDGAGAVGSDGVGPGLVEGWSRNDANVFAVLDAVGATVWVLGEGLKREDWEDVVLKGEVPAGVVKGKALLEEGPKPEKPLNFGADVEDAFINVSAILKT